MDNVYSMIVEICDWMRANRDSEIRKELFQCKSQDDMIAKYKELVLKEI